jgi:hypothetical protein
MWPSGGFVKLWIGITPAHEIQGHGFNERLRGGKSGG